MARVYPIISAQRDSTTNRLVYLTDTIMVTLLNTSATYNRAHQNLSDLVANEISGVARQTLTGKAKTDNGVDKIIWSANNVTFPTVTTGQNVGSLVVFRDGANDASRLLLAWHDLTDTLANGTDIGILWTSDGVLFERY